MADKYKEDEIEVVYDKEGNEIEIAGIDLSDIHMIMEMTYNLAYNTAMIYIATRSEDEDDGVLPEDVYAVPTLDSLHNAHKAMVELAEDLGLSNNKDTIIH